MEKNYEHSLVEDKWYKFWETNKLFSPKKEGKSFSMVIPPPNVTGALHMGHALNNTLQDIIARYARLKGKRVLWIPGTDHAGIATQNVVEKQLKKEGITREKLGREKFVERVWAWKNEYGNRITQQLRKLGASVDWEHERFTMDEGLSNAVRENFVKLYQDGFLYRDVYIVNWCPRCHTAVSDIEVEHSQEKGHLWYIKYPLKDNLNKSIVVATTRPETMFGDTAVAVNPQDKRYKDLVGKELILPLTDRVIPIIADEHVDKEFGTGAVKVTPAHDPNDFEIGKRHNLEQIIVMDTNARMNENVPKKYQGKDRLEARKILVEDLKEANFLENIQEHEHAVGHCYRCNTTIEPYLSKQWFIAMKKLVNRPLKVVQDDIIKFTPDRWKKLYFEWMENIRPWCISRQIWWGHRIPVWYCECGEEIVSKEDVKFCPKCKSLNIKQDEDVLDTWFSSALWPFSTLGWPAKTQDLKDFYPTSLLVTGYDIITFWVSRMITMGLYNLDIPFERVYIHGLVRDAEGRKMSKSLGNVVDPLLLIEEKGADVLRFTLASLVTSGGQDIRLMDDKILAGRNFINKLWNVSRYVLMQEPVAEGKIGMNRADQWILNSFNKTSEAVDAYLAEYEYSFAVERLYEFVWNEFCDWYIEMTKLHKESSQATLICVLDGILRMLHPIIPFITEEIWQNLKKHPLFQVEESNKISIMQVEWPQIAKGNNEISYQIEEVKEIIKSVRNLKSELNIPLNKKGVIAIKTDNKFLQNYIDYIKFLARLDNVIFVDSSLSEKHSLAVIDKTEIYLPLAGLLDDDKERQRLNVEIEKVTKEINFIHAKLSNSSFIEKAPSQVVAKEKAKLTSLQNQQISLQNKLKGN